MSPARGFIAARLIGQVRVHSAWLVLLALLATLMLGACAGGARQAGSGRNDIPTASDESDARKRARVRLELAAGYFQQGQATVALDEVKTALAADPGYAPAYNLRGLIYMNLQEPQLAEASFQRALQLAPRDADTLHNLGWLLCQQGRHAEALPQFQRAIDTPNYPGLAKSWMTMGVCQSRAGQWPDAERSLARAFELEPANPVTAYHLASVLLQRGDAQRAQFYVRRINGTDAASAESIWLGVRIERRLGNLQTAKTLGDQLAQRFPASRQRAAYDRGAYDEP